MVSLLIILSLTLAALLVTSVVLYVRLRACSADSIREAAEARATLTTILDTLPHPVALFSPELGVQSANEAARKLLALRPGATIDDVPYKWLRPLLEQARDTRRRVDPPGYGAAVQLFHETREYLFLPHTAPLMESPGALLGVALVLLDVTGLRQVDEAKSGLLSSLSHELKTPLTSLHMAIHLLADDLGARISPRHLELLHAARDDADRLNTLIDGILDIGRLRSGKAALQFQEVPPASILNAAAETLRREFEQRQLTLQVFTPDGTAELPLVRADPSRAAGALAALMTAARRAAKPGAAIHVHLYLDPPRLSFRVHVHAYDVDPLFSHPRSASGRDGVALAIAREVASAHGGAISSSIEPAGPRWELTLPIPAEAGRG